jgi:DNA polymerase-3 subunit epsilon
MRQNRADGVFDPLFFLASVLGADILCGVMNASPLSPLKLTRPLAVFDIEATGANPRTDRIVELAVIRLMPDGQRQTFYWRLNPRHPILAEASAIHGIFDKDVADCQTFLVKAPEIAAAFDNADMAGYNVLRFDIPMLAEEFIRAGQPFSVEDRKVVDAQRIFHRRVPRDLTAALAYYCGELHVDAHGATADALATLRVLEARLERYEDLPRDTDGLDVYCSPRQPDWADRTGRLKWQNREIVLNFGKRQGEPLRRIVREDSSFVAWMLRSDFPNDTKTIVRNAQNNVWPAPPAALPRGTDAD